MINVIITAKGSIDSVFDELVSLGLQNGIKLPEIGCITGIIELDELKKYKLVSGVLDIEEDLQCNI